MSMPPTCGPSFSKVRFKWVAAVHKPVDMARTMRLSTTDNRHGFQLQKASAGQRRTPNSEQVASCWVQSTAPALTLPLTAVANLSYSGASAWQHVKHRWHPACVPDFRGTAWPTLSFRVPSLATAAVATDSLGTGPTHMVAGAMLCMPRPASHLAVTTPGCIVLNHPHIVSARHLIEQKYPKI